MDWFTITRNSITRCELCGNRRLVRMLESCGSKFVSSGRRASKTIQGLRSIGGLLKH